MQKKLCFLDMLDCHIVGSGLKTNSENYENFEIKLLISDRRKILLMLVGTFTIEGGMMCGVSSVMWFCWKIYWFNAKLRVEGAVRKDYINAMPEARVQGKYVLNSLPWNLMQ